MATGWMEVALVYYSQDSEIGTLGWLARFGEIVAEETDRVSRTVLRIMTPAERQAEIIAGVMARLKSDKA